MLNRISTLLLATLTINNFAVAALNDTGITTCSNATQNGLPCPVAGFPDQNAKSAPILKTAGQWSTTGSMNTARSGHTATRLPNGKVLVTGGGGATAELYDPSTATWSNTSSMSTARYAHTATLLPNGKVLVAGGPSIASAEVYDPSTGTWSNTAAMSTARGYHTATLLPTGKVLVTGGDGGGATAELYDPSSGTWSNTGSMSTARSYHTATLLPNGKVLVAGGYNGSNYFTTAELYDPSSGTWSSTGSMSTTHGWWHTATLLPNGKVLVAGGVDGGATAELYDPNTAIWSNTAVMITAPRYDHTATLLPNGQVLMAGGYNNNYGSLASAEVYASSTGTWSNTGSLFTARYYHTATLLTNGQVLVAGGVNGGATAELYDPGAIAPTAVTNAPSVITSSSARFSGTVTPNGATTTASFDYGLTTSYGQTVTATPASIAATAGATAISASKTDLTCNTTYHYRAKGVNSAGTGYGADKTFTTTNSNFTITPSATAGGSINPNTAQLVACNTTKSFTLTPNLSYAKNDTVGGTCPAGSWNGNVWTTGRIVADCTVKFIFKLVHTVTPSFNSGGGTVTPNTTQIVTTNTAASFTVTPNTGYTRSDAVGGTCPVGSWNGNAWTTGLVTSDCTVTFTFNPITYAVTPSVGSGGTVTPNNAQIINHGATTSFTLAPNSGFNVNPTVTGTCPQGTWNGNIWTTGAITAACSVKFTFIATYTVNPGISGAGGTINPTDTQTVTGGQTASFTLTADSGYVINSTVTGTCPPGTWNGNVWTTGAIIANCSINFSFNRLSYLVTPVLNGGGSINPNIAQTITHGATTSFTVTPLAGCTTNPTVTGTCPQGTWNGNVWKTGAITQACTVEFNFACLGIALDNTALTWTTSGEAIWHEQTAVTQDGVDAAQSGTITNNQSSTLETTVIGPGTLTFYWKVSSEDTFDYLDFSVDNVSKAQISGTTGAWQPQQFALTSGTHTVRWTYTKDASDAAGSDLGWLDQVNWTGTVSVVNGKCGTANGGTFTTKPTTNLCESGTATTVNGTGPWTWNCNGSSGGTNASCRANLTAPAVGNAWLNPPTPTIIVEQPFALNVYANSNGVKIGGYDFLIKYDNSKLTINYTQSVTDCGLEVVCPGPDGWSNYTVTNTTGSIRVRGVNGTGVGPGTSLNLLKVYFKTQATSGTTTVDLNINELTSTQTNPIGSQNSAGGSSIIKISPGLCGDADGNIVVNIVDALAIARKVVGLPEPPKVNTTLADVDIIKNGISIVDAMHIARYSIGLVTPPEVCKIGQAL